VASNNIKGLTIEIGGDTTKLGKALEDVNKKSRDLSSELGQINKLLKLDPGNTDLLAQKQKVLAEAVSNTKEKLDTLKTAEKQVQEQFERGEVSEEQVRALQREIITATNKLESYEKAVKETAEAIDKLGDETDDAEEEIEDTKKDVDKAADSLDEMADSADKAGDASKGLGSKLGGLAAGGLKALAAGVTALIGGLVASAEASREYRTEMGKLDTAFTTAGHSSETAKKTYQELQGVLGETEQAVEAANHLAKLADNEKDLSTWTNIATGVYATFGASLPIEGLTEAANETAKTGALTGALADALNWAGVSEDDFQASLDACSTEQERQTLIMETLNGLYSDAADKYREANAEVIRANEANEAWASSMAEIGGAIEPILTDIKMLGASLVSELVPGVQGVADAFRELLNGEAGGASHLGEALSGIIDQILAKVQELLPVVMETATSLVVTLADSLARQLPALTRTLADIMSSLAFTIAESAPMLVSSFAAIAPQLVGTLSSLTTELASAALVLVTGLLNELPFILQTLVVALPELLSEFFTEVFYGLLPQLMMIITEQLPGIISSLFIILTEALPSFVETLTLIVDDLINQVLPQVIIFLTEGLPALIESLVSGLLGFIPVLLEAAITLLNSIVEAIPVIIEQLLPVLPSLIDTILTALSDALPVLLDAAIQLFFAILEAIPVLLDALTPALPVIIETIISAVLGALPLLLEAAVTLLLAIVRAIPQIIGPLTQQLPTIIATITRTLVQNLPVLIQAAVQLLMGIVIAIPQIVRELGRQLPSIIKAIVSGLKNGVSSIASVGKDLIKGLWGGIKDMTSWITDKLEGFGSSVLDGIKGFFGIKSPSRVFRDEVGKMLAEGMAVGIEDNADAPLDAMSSLSSDLLGEADELNGLTLERRLQHTFAAPESLSAAETGMLSKLDKILTAIERGQVLMLDGDKLVGGTADRMDSTLGQRRVLVERGAV
jgi:phage-related minor tail protein